MKAKRILKWTAAAIPAALLAAFLAAYWRSDNDCSAAADSRSMRWSHAAS